MLDVGEYSGTWWRPAAPDVQIPGVLTLHPEGGVSLLLLPPGDLATSDATLGAANDVFGPTDLVPVVHGLVGSTDVTLWNLNLETAPPLDMGFRSPTGASAVRFHVHRGLEGLHAPPLDTFSVHRARMRLRGLSQFLRGSAPKGVAGRSSFTRRVVLADRTLFLSMLRHSSYTSVDQAERHRQVAWAEFVLRQPVRLDPDLYATCTRPLMWLLTLANQQASALEALEVSTRRSGDVWHRVLGGGIEPERQLEAAHQPLFRFHDLRPFTTVLREWWSLCASTAHGLANYTGLYASGVIDVPHRLFLAGSALDAIGHSQYPSLVGMKPENAGPHAHVRSSLTDKKVKSWFNRVTAYLNNPEYAAILEAMVADLPPELSALLVDEAVWIKSMKTARNDVAHALERYSAYWDDIDYQMGIIYLARMVLSATLLRALKQDALQTRLQGDYSYMARVWRSALKARGLRGTGTP